MLTVRFERLGVRPGDLVLDAGAGFGRHTFALAHAGADVVALDYADDEVIGTRATFGGMIEAGEIDAARYVGVLRGDATRLPFPDATFDRVITSEVLEHIQDDVRAIGELQRVLKPGGTFAATVPSEWPEKVNWRLSDEYHAPKSVGGHVRIYSSTELKAKLRSAGLDVTGDHHAHALHSPYWWLRCAVGPRRTDSKAVNAYQRMLEWEIVEQPRSMRLVERALSPLLGKSYVIYARKVVDVAGSDAHARTDDAATRLDAHARTDDAGLRGGG
ncbi:MAG: class I SAM-dependent methyltransferase [Ilumatobacteraceae bacterium]